MPEPRTSVVDHSRRGEEMSGGIYEGPTGELLYGDGRLVERAGERKETE